MNGQIKRNRQFNLRVIAQAMQTDNLEHLNQMGIMSQGKFVNLFLRNLIGNWELQAEKINSLLEEK